MPAASTAREWATPADHAACRALIREGSKSFFAASLLLPPTVREPALALYAFCRLADDLVDRPGTADPLAALERRLDLAYRGCPAEEAADRAFARVVAAHGIPRALPEALLEGFRWDAEGRRYADLSQLRQYAARVAGSVGAMMACIMQARAPAVVARACDLGVAMQLTNIARDVGEDARAGRLYLPLDWLRESGIDPESWLQHPQFSPAIARIIERLLSAADELYERATTGIADLPRDCRRGIYAARFLYAEIGMEVRRRGCDSIASRSMVPLARKALVLARAVRAAEGGVAGPGPPPLEETRYLVEAVAAQAAGAAVPAPVRAETLEAKVAWLVELFERLERRDRESLRVLGERAG
ncbi:MAG: phytoene/squalene synthase family protein [Proteobacteria bacterium]|nr:phytoene/squalene synthase family protein [Pseudomonadota bacterium]